eukprot:COSAG06_NODE_3728_length_4969_cov_2.206897_1_plen_125_part_00
MCLKDGAVASVRLCEFMCRQDEKTWWWEFVMLFKKTLLVATGIFWNNMALCDANEKLCADGSEVGGIGGSGGLDVTCDDGSAPVPPIVDPQTGLCVAMLPGDTTPFYRGTEVCLHIQYKSVRQR